MALNKDLILSNIRKQLATQGGQMQIVNTQGAWQFADGDGSPLPGTNDATNYGLSNTPGIYVTGMSAKTYELAKGIFGGPDVPDELIQVLANLATYYSQQTGQPVTTLFRQGKMMNEFLSTVNSIRTRNSQLGYVGLNAAPNWTRNPTLGPTISAAITSGTI